MRKNFAEILQSAKIDYRNEYRKIYKMLFLDTYSVDLYKVSTLYNMFDEAFTEFRFAGTCLCLKEFDTFHGYHFPDPGKDVTLEDLVSLTEYFYNFIVSFRDTSTCRELSCPDLNIGFIVDHLTRVTEAIGYTVSDLNGVFILTEKDAAVTYVAESELIPGDFSYKMISYNHHSMRGDIEGKKAIIVRLAKILEGEEKKLDQVNHGLKKDLFYIFNNFDLRHNNCTDKTKKYKPVIAGMDRNELENWYDETYRMCLLAFMEIEQADRKPGIDGIKARIEAE